MSPLKKKKFTGPHPAQETQSGNPLPTETLAGALSSACEAMFLWLSDGAAKSGSLPFCSFGLEELFGPREERSGMDDKFEAGLGALGGRGGGGA